MPSTSTRIVVTGATGFLGRPLVDALLRDGYQITVLSRHAAGAPPSDIRHLQWTPDGSSGPWASALDGADAVINLAGESIADRRWTDAQKQRIIDSRVNATRSLATAISQAPIRQPSSSADRPSASTVRSATRWSPRIAPRALTSWPRSAYSGRPKPCAVESAERAPGVHAHRPGARTRRRRAAADAAAVPVGRWWPGRLRPPVLAVDSPRSTGSI